MLRIIPLLSALLLVPDTYARSTAEYDAALYARFTAGAPGASVLVARNGKVIYERAIGMADLRTAKALTTENQFWIASITKQFTAVAVLQLVEAGKLKLDDEIQQYVDFPRKEQPITIEHLLTHTSGIPDRTTDEGHTGNISMIQLIAQFADLPLEFPPGTNWNYSNHGYMLLTAIIEKASGLSWAEYARKNLFAPAGMMYSSAESTGGLLPNEAVGYTADSTGWVPAELLDLTWVMGAGNIRSAVGDLWRWNCALLSGKLLSPALLAKAQQSCTLHDGGKYPYGYGWRFQNVQGSRTVEHGGGINGFTSNAIYLPDEDLYVAVLANREGLDAHLLAPELAAIALGKPYGGTVVPLHADTAAAYTGVYETSDGMEWYITFEDHSLYFQRSGGERRGMHHLGGGRFLQPENLTSLTFEFKGGTVTGVHLLSRKNDLQLVRTTKPLPQPRKEIKLSNAELQPYVGEFQFEVDPGMTMTFHADGDRFFVTPTGESTAEVFAQGDHRFFLKIVDATIVFHSDADGRMTRMTFTQGEAMETIRVK